jgi:hypothetical protein
MLFSNIPLLLEILEQITQDWKREATPFQKAINDSDTEDEKLFHVSQAFIRLQPCYLKCLFSHSMFFVALEGAYNVFYAELNALNREPQFRVNHEGPPTAHAYIEKVRLVRNISIVHLGSNEVEKIDSAAAMMWQPLTLGKDISASWDLDKLTFGAMKLTVRDRAGKVVNQSADMEIGGIPELSTECSKYINKYDQICADYLGKIGAKLPVTVGDIEYSEFKKIPASVSSP